VASCKTCSHPAVSQINVALAAGSSVRSVARMFGIPRSSLARHREHVRPLERRLGLLPPGPPGLDRVDVLAEALSLLQRSRTSRERLKALEQIRAATALQLRAMRDDPDEELLERLERNLDEASAAFRDEEGFEQAVRALQGVREAVRQRLDAVRLAETIELPIEVVWSDGTSVHGRPAIAPMKLSAADYWKGIPTRYRDADRFTVKRVIQLGWPPEVATETIEIREGSALAWTNEGGNR
jgi:transposase-like protein